MAVNIFKKLLDNLQSCDNFLQDINNVHKNSNFYSGHIGYKRDYHNIKTKLTKNPYARDDKCLCNPYDKRGEYCTYLYNKDIDMLKTANNMLNDFQNYKHKNVLYNKSNDNKDNIAIYSLLSFFTYFDKNFFKKKLNNITLNDIIDFIGQGKLYINIYNGEDNYNFYSLNYMNDDDLNDLNYINAICSYRDLGLILCIFYFNNKVSITHKGCICCKYRFSCNNIISK